MLAPSTFLLQSLCNKTGFTEADSDHPLHTLSAALASTIQTSITIVQMLSCYLKAAGGTEAAPGDSSHQHEHDEHRVVLGRYIPTQCIVHKGSISDSAARERPNEEIGVLDAVVGEGMIEPGLAELHSLRANK